MIAPSEQIPIAPLRLLDPAHVQRLMEKLRNPGTSDDNARLMISGIRSWFETLNAVLLKGCALSYDICADRIVRFEGFEAPQTDGTR